MKIINGKKLATEVLDTIKQKIVDRVFRLAVISTKDDPSSRLFVSMKKKKGSDIGIVVDEYNLFNENQSELEKKINELGESYDGIVLQLPIREELDYEKLISLIQVEKNPDMLGGLAETQSFEKGLFAPVVSAILKILQSESIDYKNLKIALLGKGILVGAPFSRYLESIGKDHFVVTIENKEDIDKLIDFDIIISGVGVPNILQQKHIKSGSVLIDAGTSDLGGVMVGDISTDCYPVASVVSPVPGGVGPLTVAYLFYNLVMLSK